MNSGWWVRTGQPELPGYEDTTQLWTLQPSAAGFSVPSTWPDAGRGTCSLPPWWPVGVPQPGLCTPSLTPTMKLIYWGL